MARSAHIVGKLSDVAAFFGVKEVSVKTHWRPGMPKACGARGRWNLLEIGRWLVCSYYQKQAAPEGDLGDAMQKAKLAKLVEEAKLARIKREEKEELLVKKVDMDAACSVLCGYFVTCLEQIPAKLGPRVANKSAAKAKKILRDGGRAIQKTVFGERES